MKKIAILFLAMFSAFGLISCGSTPSTMDVTSAKQAAINQSFDRVYGAHASSLNLDGAKTYTVRKGDTLTSITKKFYAGKDENGYYFPLIMLASRNVVSDPEFITPGMKLTIPDFDKNISDKRNARKFSAYFRDLTGVYKEKDTPAAADILPHLVEIADKLAKDAESIEKPAGGASPSPAAPSSAPVQADPKTSNEPMAMPS